MGHPKIQPHPDLRPIPQVEDAAESTGFPAYATLATLAEAIVRTTAVVDHLHVKAMGYLMREGVDVQAILAEVVPALGPDQDVVDEVGVASMVRELRIAGVTEEQCCELLEITEEQFQSIYKHLGFPGHRLFPEILRMHALGKTPPEIAMELDVSRPYIITTLKRARIHGNVSGVQLTQNEIVRYTCELFNKGYSARYIAGETGTNVSTTNSRIRRGRQLGWVSRKPRQRARRSITVRL